MQNRAHEATNRKNRTQEKENDRKLHDIRARLKLTLLLLVTSGISLARTRRPDTTRRRYIHQQNQVWSTNRRTPKKGAGGAVQVPARIAVSAQFPSRCPEHMAPSRAVSSLPLPTKKLREKGRGLCRGGIHPHADHTESLSGDTCAIAGSLQLMSFFAANGISCELRYEISFSRKSLHEIHKPSWLGRKRFDERI